MFKIFKEYLIDIAKENIVCSSEGYDLEDWIIQAYVKTYNDIPRIIYCEPLIQNDSFEGISDILKIIKPLISKELRYQNINKEETLNKILNKYPDSIEFRMKELHPVVFNENFIVIISHGTVIFHQDNIIPEIFECFTPFDKNTKDTFVHYVSKGNFGFETHPFKLNVKDIEGNYNDDLPIEKINNIIQSDESGIILLNGTPGGGKSSLIRYITDKNKENRQFLYLDSSVFHSMTDSSFIKFLLNYKNSVIILEDCEQILKSREDNSRNELISTILNISDGLLGDGLNLKFICTFNTDLNNIDKAITRKGRLKLKYEIKPLCKEKVAKIFEKRGIDPKLAKDMTLAEVYNFEKDNGSKETRKTVGFGV